MTMRFIVLGVPHTVTHPDFAGCAFTQKVLKFIKMMSGRGHEIIHLGHERSQIHSAPDVKHYTVITDDIHRQSYGDEYVDAEAWRERGFAHYFRIDDLAHQTYHRNAIEVIKQIQQPRDFILHFWGWGTRAVGIEFPDLINVEPGIGYGSAWCRWRVYESHAIRNALSGPQAITTCTQDWYHAVIPNYFDPEDFDYSETKSDYHLYLGRVYSGKGVDIAIESTAEAGHKLVIAGQGSLEAMGYREIPEHVEYVGYADPALRRRLMSNAQSLIIGSRYLEPFGGVQIEAMLSGTPVISPDWGAFAEYNLQDLTGFRCRTFRDYVEGIINAHLLSPDDCRGHALNFTLEQIAPKYERYFSDVLDVYAGRGWYEL